MPGLRYMKLEAPRLKTRIDVSPLIYWVYDPTASEDGNGALSKSTCSLPRPLGFSSGIIYGLHARAAGFPSN